jgi:RNA polymerase sigma-70 factor (ECF subfamily)
MVAEVLSSTVCATPNTRVAQVDPRTNARDAARHDAVLVDRFTSGDADAFDEIIARYRDKLAAFAFTVLHNHADAEEIAQDALIRAHRNLHRFRGDCTLASWLYTITLNLGRNRYWYYFRRHRHEAFSLDCPLNDNGPATFSDLAVSDAPNPVEELNAREFSAAVAVGIGKLAPLHRDILERSVFRHHSYDEIASGLGIGVGTVKSRLARAREKLRSMMALQFPEQTSNTGAAPTRSRNLAPPAWRSPSVVRL